MGSVAFPAANQIAGNIDQVAAQMSAAAIRQQKEAELVSSIMKLDRHGLASECARLRLTVTDNSIEGLRAALFACLRAQR